MTEDEVDELYQHARALREVASALNKMATVHEIAAAKFETLDEVQAYVSDQFEKRLTQREKEALQEKGL